MIIIHISKRYILLIIICMINISCCYKRNIDDNLYKKDLNSIKEYINNKHPSYINEKEKIQKQIKQFENINIIYFNSDQYDILPKFFHILNQYANFLRKHQYIKIMIEGHTDEQGTPEYNIALGERRAHSTKIYLQSHGVIENQISSMSYGKEKPFCFGHTEKDYQQNRRVVLNIN